MKIFLLMGLLTAIALPSLSAQQAELPRLAVVEFGTNINNEKINADAIAVRNLVESHMVRTGRYQIITRDEIDKLLAEQRIQVSAITSTENIQRLQLQNINYIVTGSVDAIGNDYAITIRVLNVSTGRFSHSDNDFMGNNSRELFNGINTLMSKFIAGMSADESGAIMQGPGRGRTYNVGDFGPAGGIVFYDKGVFSNGWRYLEAAPVETEFRAQWGAFRQNVSGTGLVIGSGRRNTELIMEHLNHMGEMGRAAQLCTNLNFNGFNDWFLPSRDELNMMYQNLRRRNLGSFGSDWYWSSSQSEHRNDALAQRFNNGSQNAKAKRDDFLIRAVRAF
jgi:hypothetical protein